MMKEFNVRNVTEDSIVAETKQQMMELYVSAMTEEDCVINWKDGEYVLSRIMNGIDFREKLESGFVHLITSKSLEDIKQENEDFMKEVLRRSMPKIKKLANEFAEKIQEHQEQEEKKKENSKKVKPKGSGVKAKKTEKKGRGRPKKQVKRGRGRPKKN